MMRASSNRIVNSILSPRCYRYTVVNAFLREEAAVVLADGINSISPNADSILPEFENVPESSVREKGGIPVG